MPKPIHLQAAPTGTILLLPSPWHRVPATFATPQISLSSHRKAAVEQETAGNLCYQQRNHIFPAGIAAVGAGCPAGMSVSMPTSGSHTHSDAHVPNPCQEGAQGCWNPEGLIVWITAANSIISLHPGWRPHCQCEKGHLSDLSGLKRRISPKSSMKGCSRKSSSHC